MPNLNPPTIRVRIGQVWTSKNKEESHKIVSITNGYVNTDKKNQWFRLDESGYESCEWWYVTEPRPFIIIG